MTNTMFVDENGNLTNLNISEYDIKNYQTFDIPILYLSGSIAGMNKDNAVTLDYIYGEKSGACTLKWQGASSINCEKKNYTIKFDNAFEAVSGWGSQNKYCLKANFVDASHARNIVSAKLWGEVVKSRTPANATLNALPNGGAVDGFPIIISLNGEFHGLYTFNIPKDGWMFGMDETGKQAILCADNYSATKAVSFKGLATFTEDSDGYLDFDLEYSSDDEFAWVLESLNRLITAVKDSDGTNITYGITPYLDWESAIDYYIFSVLTANYDGIWRNYLLSTYDGVKWFFTGYDMDHTFLLRASGTYFYDPDYSVDFETVAGMHKVFELIWKYMRPQLRARYNELRADIMSECHLATKFCDFVAKIPSPLFVDDVRLWQTIPSSGANNIYQILNAYRLRVIASDEWVKVTSGETALPEQVDPSTPAYTNQMPISIDSSGNIYNGTGWKGQYRLSASSGSEKTNDFSGITGFIPVKAGDVVRFKDATDAGATNGVGGILWGEDGAVYGTCSIVYYDASFAFLGSVTLQPAYYGICNDGNNGGIAGCDPTGSCLEGDTVQFTVPSNGSIKYLRISASTVATNGSHMANLVLTVNEEIV